MSKVSITVIKKDFKKPDKRAEFNVGNMNRREAKEFRKWIKKKGESEVLNLFNKSRC